MTAVVVLHASPIQVSIVTALGTGAYLVLGIPVGVWVDRWSKRYVLIAADLVRSIAVLTIPIAFLAGWLTITQVMIVAAVVSVTAVFFETAHSAILPSLVGRDQVSEANARLASVDTTIRVVAPGVAGQLLRIMSAPILYFATAAASAFAAFLIWTMKVIEPDTSAADQEQFWSSAKTGIVFVLRHQALKTLMYASAFINLGAGVFNAIFPVFVLRDLEMEPETFGVVLSIGATGGIIGSLIGLKVMTWLGEVRTVLVTYCLLPIAFLCLPAASVMLLPPVVMVGLCDFLFGVIIVVSMVSGSGIRAKVTPHQLMGRVTAASRFVTLGAVPLGALAGGLLAVTIGNPWALVVAAGLAAVAAVIMLCSPLRRHRRLPSAWEARDEFAAEE